MLGARGQNWRLRHLHGFLRPDVAESNKWVRHNLQLGESHSGLLIGYGDRDRPVQRDRVLRRDRVHAIRLDCDVHIDEWGKLPALPAASLEQLAVHGSGDSVCLLHRPGHRYVRSAAD